MKRNLLTAMFIFLSLGFLASCGSNDEPDVAKVLLTKNDSIAYAIGMDIGTNISKFVAENGFDTNKVALVRGFRDAIMGDSAFTTKERNDILMQYQMEMQKKQMAKMSEAAGPNKQAGQKFLEENKAKEGVTVTASGLQYKVLKAGNGPKPAANDDVTVNYEGRMIDGKVFDSSYERKKPETLSLGNVIPGFQEGMMLMNTGSTYELYIPSELAYGDRGQGDIPGGSTLVFKIELLKIEAPKAAK